MTVYSINNRRSEQEAWTIFEVLAIVLIIFVPISLGQFTAKRFGVLPGGGAGILSAALCATGVVFFYRAKGRQHENQRRELREKYRGVYRVIALPIDETSVKKPPGAEIKVGDYGWEAQPPKGKDGLIYLQGLTAKWQVVWYAGFRPDQIGIDSLKTRSQYDWDYSWVKNPPLCPFPVQERETANMGLPDVYGWNGPKHR